MLVALHVAGVIADWLITGDNLIRAIWDGFKRVPLDSCDANAVSLWRLGIAVVLPLGGLVLLFL